MEATARRKYLRRLRKNCSNLERKQTMMTLPNDMIWSYYGERGSANLFYRKFEIWYLDEASAPLEICSWRPNQNHFVEKWLAISRYLRPGGSDRVGDREVKRPQEGHRGLKMTINGQNCGHDLIKFWPSWWTAPLYRLVLILCDCKNMFPGCS